MVVCGRSDDAGNDLATELRALGVEAEYFRADVRHEDDVRSLVDRTVKRFGRLDIAVNNAGTEPLCFSLRTTPPSSRVRPSLSMAANWPANSRARYTQLIARNNHNQEA